MNPGRMNRRVELQAPIRVLGGDSYVTEWQTVATVWAEFLKIRAEVVANFTDGVRVEIAVRYRTDIKKGWRAVENAPNNTITYGVVGVYDQYRNQTVLICEEVVS